MGISITIRNHFRDCLQNIQGIHLYDSLATPLDDNRHLPACIYQIDRMRCMRQASLSPIFQVEADVSVIIVITGTSESQIMDDMDNLVSQILRAILNKKHDELEILWENIEYKIDTEAHYIGSSHLIFKVKAMEDLTIVPKHGIIGKVHTDIDIEGKGIIDVTWEGQT